jgi:hypothetical protein
MSQQILLISRLVLLLSILSLSTSVSAQKTKWRYVQTIVGGVKVYLKDDFQKLKNKNLLSWDKRIKADGSHAVSQIEWDCQNKQFLTKEMTMYEPDNTLIGVSNKFNWKPVVPDSVGDTLYNQICFPPPEVQFAEIITVKANLRFLPNPDAEVLRIAKKEDKFIVLPQTATNGWYNLVDEQTQEDYWVHGNAIKIIPSEKEIVLPTKKYVKLKRR